MHSYSQLPGFLSIPGTNISSAVVHAETRSIWSDDTVRCPGGDAPQPQSVKRPPPTTPASARTFRPPQVHPRRNTDTINLKRLGTHLGKEGNNSFIELQQDDHALFDAARRISFKNKRSPVACHAECFIKKKVSPMSFLFHLFFSFSFFSLFFLLEERKETGHHVLCVVSRNLRSWDVRVRCTWSCASDYVHTTSFFLSSKPLSHTHTH